MRVFDTRTEAEQALQAELDAYVAQKIDEHFFVSTITLNEQGDESWTPTSFDALNEDANLVVTNTLEGIQFKATKKSQCLLEMQNRVKRYAEVNAMFGCVQSVQYEKSIGCVPPDSLKTVLEANGFWCAGAYDFVDTPVNIDALRSTYNKGALKQIFQRAGFGSLRETVLDANTSKELFDSIDYRIYTKVIVGRGSQPQQAGYMFRTFNSGAELYTEIHKDGGTLGHSLLAQETFYDSDEVRYIVNLWGVVNGAGEVHFYPTEITPEASQPHGQFTTVLDDTTLATLKQKCRTLLSQEGLLNTPFGLQFLEGKDGDYYPIDLNFGWKWQEMGLYPKLKPDYIVDVFKFCFDMLPSIPENNHVCVYRFFDCTIPSDRVFNFEKFEALCNSMGCGTTMTTRDAGYASCLGPNQEAPPLMCERPTHEEAKQIIEALETTLHESVHLFTDPADSTLQ